jgi:hypothetical protein
VHAARCRDDPYPRVLVDLLAELVDLGVAGANQLVVVRLRRDDASALVDCAAARKAAFRERSVDPELFARGDGERCVS